MSIHRALRASFALSLIVAACLLPAAGVHAQEPLVSLTLFSQTPVTTNSEPELELVVRAVNAGDTAIGDLSIGFTIGPTDRLARRVRADAHRRPRASRRSSPPPILRKERSSQVRSGSSP